MATKLIIVCLLTGAIAACSKGVTTSVEIASPAIGHASLVDGYVPLGVFEDANIYGGDTVKFEAMLKDLRAHGLDTVLFTNNVAARDAQLLDVSDRMGMNVFMLPTHDLYRDWWPDKVPANIQTARAVAQPIVDLWSKHPSLKGYVVIDEPPLKLRQKVKLMVQAFRELDPSRPAIMTLIGKNRVGPIFEAAKPDVMQIDVYPAGKGNPPCDFTMTGFAYTDVDFVSYIRGVTAARQATTPLWIIMQTHSFDAGIHSLRTPSRAEVRMQHWLAVGEGATGFYWFVYSTQQSWIGLKDNAELYDEVADLARRTRPLNTLLLSLHKDDDHFSISGQGDPYVSTLVTPDDTRTYAVAVNRDCVQAQKLTITSDDLKRSLRDVETGAIYALGADIEFQPGDGKVFEVVDVAHVPVLLR